MERDYKELTTPSGHVVKVKAWMTGREKRNIQGIMMAESDMVDGQIKVNPAKYLEYQDTMLQEMVVSINGDTGKVLEMLLDMKAEDYDFVLEQVNELVADKKK